MRQRTVPAPSLPSPFVSAAILALGLLAAACASALRAEPVPVEPAVYQGLEAGDSVGVVVVLVTPTSYYRNDPDRRRRDIRKRQDEVLSALEPGSYQIRHRFQNVPAMTLTVFSEATIRTLSLHKRVSRIGVDDGSGGGFTP